MKIRYPSWHDQAACEGVPIAYFESKHPLDQADTLMEWCARCPVREQCEADALESGDYRWLVRGNRIRSNRDSIREWIDPAYDSCGTRAGPPKHRREGEPNCTACALVLTQINREYEQKRK